MKKTTAVFTASISAALIAAMLFAQACAVSGGSGSSNAPQSTEPNALASMKPFSTDSDAPQTLLPMDKDSDEKDIDWEFFRVSWDESHVCGQASLVQKADERDALASRIASTADSANSRIDKEAFAKKFGDEFFIDHYLVVFTVQYSSGSIKPEIAGVRVENGTTVIKVETTSPDVVTGDMAEHICVIALNKADYPIDNEIRIDGVASNGGATE